MGDVIGSREYDHGMRLEIDHVATKPQEHLMRNLAAYASANVVIVCKKLRVFLDPSGRDGIAHEDNSLSG